MGVLIIDGFVVTEVSGIVLFLLLLLLCELQLLCGRFFKFFFFWGYPYGGYVSYFIRCFLDVALYDSYYGVAYFHYVLFIWCCVCSILWIYSSFYNNCCLSIFNLVP